MIETLNFTNTSPIFIIGTLPATVALSYTLRTEKGRKGWIDNQGVIFTMWDMFFVWHPQLCHYFSRFASIADRVLEVRLILSSL
jgi:hypothetical protein